MYARVITTQLLPGKVDDAISLWRDNVTPSLKQTKGFRGAYLLGDRATGKGVTITLWESEADAVAMDTSGQYQQTIAMFAAMFAAPPSRERYEVFVEVNV